MEKIKKSADTNVNADAAKYGIIGADSEAKTNINASGDGNAKDIESESAAQPEPIIIDGGATEIVFEPESDNAVDSESVTESADSAVNAVDKKPTDKNLRIIEGGGKEIVIDDAPSEHEKAASPPECRRSKRRDKLIGDVGTYIAIAFLIATIAISLLNVKGMRYPLSCLFLSLAGLTMGITTLLRYFNNKKCGCSVCKAQGKTFVYSAVLWYAVFIGAMIAFIVLITK